MLKKMSVFILFFIFVEIVSSQTIDMVIQSEEYMKWGNTSYQILHLYVYQENTDINIVKSIGNYLLSNHFFNNLNLNNIESIDRDQFDIDLGLGDWRGGHPIFEMMNPNCDWHTIQYRGYLYVIKTYGYGSYEQTIFKVKIG